MRDLLDVSGVETQKEERTSENAGKWNAKRRLLPSEE